MSRDEKMKTKRKISAYREQLDNALSSSNLANREYVKNVIRNKLLCSSYSENQGNTENVVERRTIEVSNFLDMVKSASEPPHADWKMKEDSEQFRVMYREGPQGTPFHTLLVEGYMDAPVDVCLCVGWESDLYDRWWPQYTIPTFKIITTKCLQKVRIGEQISLVRMKVSWPLSDREAIVHFFELEFFEDDLIIVLLNSISDLESINRSTHGFTNEGIPKPEDIVRIDLVGGFVLKKLTSETSYFRTLATMDIKLDFVPPSFINFVSRQLIGSACKLYKKVVSSAKVDEKFSKALEDPLYIWVRQGLYSENKLQKAPEIEAMKNEKPLCLIPEEHSNSTSQAHEQVLDRMFLNDDHTMKTPQDDKLVIDETSMDEITEEIEQDRQVVDNSRGKDFSPTNLIPEKCLVNKKKKGFISTEVEQALGILDQAISMVRSGGFSNQNRSSSGSPTQEFLDLEEDQVADVISSQHGVNSSVVSVEAPKMDNMNKCIEEMTASSDVQNFRPLGPDSPKVNHNRVAPLSPEKSFSVLVNNQQVALNSSHDGKTEPPLLDHINKDFKEGSAKVNGIHKSNFNGETEKIKHQKVCCLPFILRHSG
ncbi:PREDICTED: uncharacterized protein LOC104601456 isoform X1 [Nelumbo nucifera]|uniref:Uncharacterized protein LOC104601456 isoform X1 n=2 Tax=Nelumbo nucifera TaxID=4432 RepID=A0A1U8ACF6_NELNU|nr:PREDICTED: uncharacterized protein LOC104601456 isoform X1 [Nelumbo nucifera]XP_010263089.1 PREDICTED: uncharacterized protein LOC104601456 isoform X1 [Nelumbo nucifera]XP_010263090.1 PREDICTED: uncharacterized protein LOC104601456 isoform X1 [Nelumbo nucifera]